MPVAKSVLLFLVFVSVLLLPGCDAAMAIFEAGWWIGVIVAVIVVGAVFFVISKMKR